MNKMLIKSTLANIYTVLCCVVIAIGLCSLVMTATGIRPFVMISESMHPEVPKGSLVLLNTSASLDSVKTGDNVAYILGSVEAMHKTVSVGQDELIVKSLADDGTSVVTAGTYLGKEVLSIPAVGGWIREIVKYRWVVIGIAGLLVVAGCVPRKARKDESEKAAAQST
jgi:signal peptidase I